MISALFLLFAGSGLPGQTHDGVKLVEARLIADSETIVPGRPIMLGLHLKMAPGWHTYWEYSGDAGLPITLALDLPEGFRTTPLQWPLPYRMVEPGDLEVYGYKDEVLLLMRLFPPARLDVEKVALTGFSDWLVCEAICLPGEAEVSLELAVGDKLSPVNTELFERFQEKLPEPLRGRAGEPVALSWERSGNHLLLTVAGPSEWSYDFYPLPPQNVVLGHPETMPFPDGEAAVVRIPLESAPSEMRSLPGVLVAEENDGKRRGWRVSAR